MSRTPRLTNREFIAEAKRRGWLVRHGKGDHVNVLRPGLPIIVIRNGRWADIAPPVAMRALRETVIHKA